MVARSGIRLRLSFREREGKGLGKLGRFVGGWSENVDDSGWREKLD